MFVAFDGKHSQAKQHKTVVEMLSESCWELIFNCQTSDGSIPSNHGGQQENREMLLRKKSCYEAPAERECYNIINESSSSSKKHHQHDSKESRRAFLVWWSSVAVIVGSSLLLSLSLGMLLVQREKNPRINVAFVGSSFQFVNDLPRFLEALSLGNIHQDSMLHGSLSLVTLLQRGNGMHNKWNTTNAALKENGIFDYGECSIPQLLFGYDDDLSFRNKNGCCKGDGMNPCFQDDECYKYRKARTSPSKWNYVILNDQSVRPAYEKKRNASINPNVGRDRGNTCVINDAWMLEGQR
jgi:hypothetical protein